VPGAAVIKSGGGTNQTYRTPVKKFDKAIGLKAMFTIQTISDPGIISDYFNKQTFIRGCIRYENGFVNNSPQKHKRYQGMIIALDYNIYVIFTFIATEIKK
jgi:hypothetical protein